MKRILLMVLRNLVHVPYMWCKLCHYAKHADRYTEKERYEFLKKLVKRANNGGNVHIEVYGQEHIPEEDGFLFFPNHQGLYDALAIVAACPDHPFSVVSKKEVKDIPFLKQVFACIKAIMIDREDIRQSMKVIIEVADEVSKGRNYLIFAEGTRSKNGNQVGEFKGGSFKAATKTKCPIIPIALIDSFKPFDTKSVEQVNVQVHFLEPLLYEEYQHMKTVEIAVEVQRRISTTIEQYEVSGKA